MDIVNPAQRSAASIRIFLRRRELSFLMMSSTSSCPITELFSVALGDRPPRVKHLKLPTCPIPVHFTQEWILPPLGRSTAPSCQILLIKRLTYQRLDYRLSTDVQLFGGPVHFREIPA
jgi:hypothetical protein